VGFQPLTTRKATELGDHDWRQLLEQHHAVVRKPTTASAATRSRPPAMASW
jgi:hypothetical protein